MVFDGNRVTEERSDNLHRTQIEGRIDWLKKNGKEEQEELLKGVYDMIRSETSTFSGALEWMVEERLPALTKKMQTSGDSRVDIASFPEDYKDVKSGYMTYLESIYPEREIQRKEQIRNNKDIEKIKKYIKDNNKDINDIFSMIENTIYKVKKAPEGKIQEKEVKTVLQKIQEEFPDSQVQEEVNQDKQTFPKELFEVIIIKQDEKVVRKSKKFLKELEEDIRKETESSQRTGLEEPPLPEHMKS